MKTIEQKAKAYDEALKVLHKYDGANIMFSQSLKEEMFPELKEGEDERTWIINYLSNRILNSTIIAEKENLKKAIAWLERQGEQKPAEWNNNDEVLLDETLHFIREFQQSDRCIDEGDMQNSVICENWLKSIKERYTWKPSDEQMKCISDVVADAKYKNNISMNGYEPYTHLYTLLRQLKKLREE